jgi:hypothetical protein
MVTARPKLRTARERLVGEWIETGRVGGRPVADFAERAAEEAAEDARIEAQAAEHRLPAAPAEEFLTLQCPPGAEGAPISHGAVGYRAYLLDLRDPHSPWLVDVPLEAARHLLRSGFHVFDPAAPS